MGRGEYVFDATVKVEIRIRLLRKKTVLALVVREANSEGGGEGQHERVRQGVRLLLPLQPPGFGIELAPRSFNADMHAHASNRSNDSGGGGGINNNNDKIAMEVLVATVATTAVESITTATTTVVVVASEHTHTHTHTQTNKQTYHLQFLRK